MRRKKLILWIVGALLVILLCAGVLLVLRDFLVARSQSIFESRARSREILVQMGITCPPNTQLIDRPHGEVGWMMFCESDGIEEGPWLAAGPNGLTVRGQHCGGEECGTWEFYEWQTGNLRKTMEYGQP